MWWGTLTPVWQPVPVQQMPNGQRASLGQSPPVIQREWPGREIHLDPQSMNQLPYPSKPE